ncbi:MAG: HNH endonuclease, partial [Phycisphaerae bacterium]|nr:HNH endonuclease [Phycisphaerae bacterium]
MDRITIKSTIELPLFLVRLCMRIVLLYRRLRFGYPFMRIALAEGNFAIVDPEDYLKLCRFSWQLKKCPHTSYAWRGFMKEGKKIILYMHREIMNPPKGMLIDHINHDGLDNRRANLRFAT